MSTIFKEVTSRVLPTSQAVGYNYWLFLCFGIFCFKTVAGGRYVSHLSGAHGAFLGLDTCIPFAGLSNSELSSEFIRVSYSF